MAKMEVDVSALAGFTPSEGGRALLSRNGIFKTKIRGIEFGTAQKSGNKTMTVSMEIQGLTDDDPDAGVFVEKTLAVTGKVQTGRSAGEDNILQLGGLLAAAGRDTEAIRALAARGTLDLEMIKGSLLDEAKNTCYVACNAKAFEGRISSEVSGFIPTPRAVETIEKGRAAQPYNLEKLEAVAATQKRGDGETGTSKSTNGVHAGSAASKAVAEAFEGQI